jgi:hypothetical protein
VATYHQRNNDNKMSQKTIDAQVEKAGWALIFFTKERK